MAEKQQDRADLLMILGLLPIVLILGLVVFASGFYLYMDRETPSTAMTVKGVSATDPIDRVVSLYVGGVEVARYITPLSTEMVLPESFTWTVSLPFATSESSFSTTVSNHYWRTTSWNITIVNYVESGSAQPVRLVVGLTRMYSLVKQTFTVGHPATVYFLASGHDTCESRNMTMLVDGYTYPVFNWNPTGSDNRGEAIPAIPVLLDSGQHSIEFEGCSVYSLPYVLVSAYEVG